MQEYVKISLLSGRKIIFYEQTTTTTTILYSAEENFDKIIQPAEIAKLVEAGCDIIYLDYLL